MEYDAVLKEAQDLGFAEADPTADVDGLDVRAKIALLTKLAIGVYVDPEKVNYQLGLSAAVSFLCFFLSSVLISPLARRLAFLSRRPEFV